MTGDPVAQPVPSNERRLALAAAITTVILWASAFVGIRAASRTLSPGSLALARLVVGTIALGMLVAVRRQPLARRTDIPALLACGLLWFGAYNLLLNQAERTVDAGTAAMLVNVGPVFVAILSGLFLREGFPRRVVLGCLIGFAGAVVIGFATSTRGFQAWAIYLGLFPTAVGFGFWAYALARTSGGRMGAMGYLVPPVAIVMGWLVLGDVPPQLALLGGVLCLAGVAVTRGTGIPRRLGVDRRISV